MVVGSSKGLGCNHLFQKPCTSTITVFVVDVDGFFKRNKME